jgi:uncharacterized membrane protein YhiD involved in acid resistance
MASAILGTTFWLQQSPETALGLPAGLVEHGVGLREAAFTISLAAVLGAALAFRPVRKGTPTRDPAVIQTQIVLSCVGAIIMLVVGASIARAFGIVGAASLVRYRAKIADPKDAAVMLVALAIGLATGVGIYWVAGVATLLILIVLYFLESFEPAPSRKYLLTIKDADLDQRRDSIEAFFRRQRIAFDLRSTAPRELSYEVEVPARKRTDGITKAIIADVGPDETTTVEWARTK